MADRIWLSSPHMGGEEEKYVAEAFATNWISPVGPHLEAFEHAIGNYLDSNDPPYVAALSSGTAAIHLALRILGVGEGDMVLCQSFTFCGSVNPVLYERATPVLIDSEADTWNMDPEQLELALKRYGKKVKAIIPVHLYGMPAKIDEIVTLAKAYNVPVIEDAAEALGSKYKNQYCGTFGDMAVLSFNGNKIITTSGGGALVSREKSYIDKAKFLSTQARDQAPYYQHSQLGYNYRLSNVSAGIGLGQMRVLPERVKQRRLVNQAYREFFKGIQGVEVFQEPNDRFYSNHWLTTILFNIRKPQKYDPEDLRIHLLKDNIEARPLWKPMHMQPLYNGYSFTGVGYSQKLYARGLCLPSGSNLNDSDLQRILDNLKAYFIN